MASILERWMDLFPDDKPSENPSAVAGGIKGANTHENSLGSSSPWHEDGWSESSPHPVRGDVEMADLGNIFVRGFYRGKGNKDDELDGLINFMNFRKTRPGPVNDKIRAKSDQLLRLGRTGEGKAIRGDYRVPDKKHISDWSDFTQEAVANSGDIQTKSLTQSIANALAK